MRKKIYIGEIYNKVGDSVPVTLPLDFTLAKILQWILTNVDHSVPTQLFKTWCDGDTTNPFIWNDIEYHWGYKNKK